MTDAQLKEGVSLNETIIKLQREKTIWESANSFGVNPQVVDKDNSSFSVYVNLEYINFDIVKALTLDRINKLLNESETRLAAL